MLPSGSRLGFQEKHQVQRRFFGIEGGCGRLGLGSSGDGANHKLPFSCISEGFSAPTSGRFGAVYMVRV